MRTLATIFFTSLATTLLLAALSAGAFVYVVGGYFVDLALARGSGGDPQAPPVIAASLSDPNVHLPKKPEAQSEDWTLHSFDGLRLAATHFSPDALSHRWVVLLHGYGRSQADTWDYAEAYIAHGYHVLTPDLRASGKSEGKYVTMGAFESRDVAAWISRIAEVDPAARVVLHGVSMGAATALLAAGRDDAPPNLVAVVEDSGYTSAEDMFVRKMESFNLPASVIMRGVDYMSREKTGVALSDASALDAVRRMKTPTLFIHGTSDLLVPYSMMQELAAASSAPQKEALTVEGAWHAAAKAKDPENYYRHVFAFADRWTN
ncbi:alpha/beta hydrolase [Selenomonas sp.]|uniref:alpha/beta hydrolase n=1 Tax=Selenomonas sp. TaxID=2053611 RepID=UPI003FA1F777